jgi:aspartate racemase
MSSGQGGNVLGVLGGMGGLASAEFVRTIYEYSGRLCLREQDAPAVVLYSDPGFPDRTEALLRGDDGVLLDRLVESLERLRALGTSRIVICCMTIHHLLPRLPRGLREQIIPLTDVAFAQVESLKKRHLVICSSGTRRLGLLQTHPRWEQVKDYLVFPGEADQDELHGLIYEVKRNRGIQRAVSFIESLLSVHGMDSFVAACSEIHLLTKLFDSPGGGRQGYGCVDPLALIAKQVAEWHLYES